MNARHRAISPTAIAHRHRRAINLTAIAHAVIATSIARNAEAIPSHHLTTWAVSQGMLPLKDVRGLALPNIGHCCPSGTHHIEPAQAVSCLDLTTWAVCRR